MICKRKHNKKTRAILPVLIILSSAVLTGCIEPYTAKNTDNELIVFDESIAEPSASAFVNDENGLLDERRKRILEDYAYRYAETLCTLNPHDISDLFAGQTEDYYKNKAAFEVLTGIRKMSKNDLILEYARVTYNVQEVTENDGVIEVVLTEDNVQKFSHLSGPSYSYNLNHIFTLVMKDGDLAVETHEQEEDFFLLTLEAWDDATGSSLAQKAENTVNILIADAAENIEELKISTGNPPEDIRVADTNYDRDAVVAYAAEWCNKRNYSGQWLAYDMFGGNCQNFASQCIYAGGIEMDYKGYPECQWKFYSETQNSSRTKSGRSYSWTGVDPFYTYATLNRSTGLICQADLALEYAEKGDIVQVGAYYDWRHSLVVIDVINDGDGSRKDIVVASNTADRWNYPLSAYIYTYPRLIHILGQNR